MLRVRRGLVGLLFAMGVVGSLVAGEANYFRSDQGVSAKDDTPLPSKCDESELVWRVALGPGLLPKWQPVSTRRCSRILGRFVLRGRTHTPSSLQWNWSDAERIQLT
jgi:hypothetical protein